MKERYDNSGNVVEVLDLGFVGEPVDRPSFQNVPVGPALHEDDAGGTGRAAKPIENPSLRRSPSTTSSSRTSSTKDGFR